MSDNTFKPEPFKNTPRQVEVTYHRGDATTTHTYVVYRQMNTMTKGWRIQVASPNKPMTPIAELPSRPKDDWPLNASITASGVTVKRIL